jgi:hypothetical protein
VQAAPVVPDLPLVSPLPVEVPPVPTDELPIQVPEIPAAPQVPDIPGVTDTAILP